MHVGRQSDSDDQDHTSTVGRFGGSKTSRQGGGMVRMGLRACCTEVRLGGEKERSTMLAIVSMQTTRRAE